MAPLVSFNFSVKPSPTASAVSGEQWCPLRRAAGGNAGRPVGPLPLGSAAVRSRGRRIQPVEKVDTARPAAGPNP